MELTDVQEKFPFLTILRYRDEEFIGIVQNSDEKIISFYDYNSIKTDEEKKLFLKLGDIWWYESSRLIPLNIFLSGQLTPFRYCLKTFIYKDITVLLGPVTSLDNIVKKRIKRRQIQLIRKVI